MRLYALAIALLITLYMPASHEALAESPTSSLDDLSRFEIDRNVVEMRKLTDFERIKRLKIAEHVADVKRLKAERQAEAERKERARLAREKAERERAKAVIHVEATFYGADCNGCSGITATGDNVRGSIYVGGYRVIAVDPSVIPLRSIVRVTLSSGETFEAISSDTGGAIKGAKIDVLVSSEAESYKHGRQTATVEILQTGGRR